MRDSFKSYRDLEVWQKSMVLAKEVYQVTSSFPADEKFGLINQIRRAAVSIPSNLAEGHARSGTKEFKHFISMAIGSVAELETQILLSTELGYLNHDRGNDLLVELDTIGKMLRGLQKSLNKKEEMQTFNKSQASNLKPHVTGVTYDNYPYSFPDYPWGWRY